MSSAIRGADLMPLVLNVVDKALEVGFAEFSRDHIWMLSTHATRGGQPLSSFGQPRVSSRSPKLSSVPTAVAQAVAVELDHPNAGERRRLDMIDVVRRCGEAPLTDCHNSPRHIGRIESVVTPDDADNGHVNFRRYPSASVVVRMGTLPVLATIVIRSDNNHFPFGRCVVKDFPFRLLLFLGGSF
jgi:hypothetical protein